MKAINTHEELRSNWYSWTVSIDGTVEELSNIKRVTYFLHPTFATNQMVSTNPADKFARTMQGWGEFLIIIEAEMTDNDKQIAKLWLDLGFDHTYENKQKYNGTFEKMLGDYDISSLIREES